MSSNDRDPDRHDAHEEPHPSYDPSGDEPAGSSTGRPRNDQEAADRPRKTESPAEEIIRARDPR